ncbi:MAG: N-6 DNA methylase [Planctomycetes bacterium]|nr:N-6 DNA methylase [Planctomycetota bacterium]
MPDAKTPAPDSVIDLVERFALHRDQYQQSGYGETQLRREFLDPFFKALGWDVDNRQGHHEAYKEVIHEDAIRVEESIRAPDYCFRVGGLRKFFVEAKKPSVDIRDAVSPAFQLRRYAWSAKLPLSILTDFEELAVYDCRVKPDKKDKAATARVMYLKFDEYVDRWGELADIFSKEAILKGAFDKYAASHKKKRGTAEVDDAFLEEIESWRLALAKNIALRNESLSQRELNFAVQRIIDRIIFLRMCEGRGIERHGQLQALTNGKATYRRLCELFQRADEKFNSGLFHFHKEKGREPPDELTPSLTIDDKVLKDILTHLYYPESPYEFAVLPSDILGQVYEQFLGKVIRLTKGHRAVVEDKPEVKKAGGVYYTPTYIVDYIVKNTLGKLLEDKSAAQADKLRVLDPACGSGSFLIVAYQYLLDWYREHYAEHDPAKWSKGRQPRIYQGPDGSWRLTSGERKRILLGNIHGVDIDFQAVEVTKLSLLLKVLEGESEESLGRQFKLFHKERALPDLASNIKCGNSLIGPDFYDNRQLELFDEDERLRINVFDWKTEFPKIMKRGGFDVVIGNPPYVDIKALPDSHVKYIFGNYHAANNRINLFATFIERCLQLIHDSHFRLSMIVPTAVLAQTSYADLRRMILDNFSLCNIVRLPNESFGSAAGDVKVDTVILVITNSTKEASLTEIIGYAGYDRIVEIDANQAHLHEQVRQDRWKGQEGCVWSINTSDRDEEIIRKCEEDSIPVSDCVEFCLGLTPYDKYKGHSQTQIKERAFHSTSCKDETFKKLLAGKDVRRYRIDWNGKDWISYGPWLGAPRQQKFFTEKRILVKQIIDWTDRRIWASVTDEELYNTQNAFNLLKKDDRDLEFILGVLNSRLMTFYHRKKYLDEFKMRFQKILIKDCRCLPIPRGISSKYQTRCDAIAALVTQMLSLQGSDDAAATPHEQTALQRQIDATDRRIDALVYQLYGLSDGEIRIVEEATAK